MKHKRAAEQRSARTKKLAIAATVLVLLMGALPFLKGSKPAHTPTPEAMREYELGRWYYNQLTPDAHNQALEHLKKAVELDPKFSKPYNELIAIFVWARPRLFADGEERIRKTKELADKLLALDPTLAEGHVALSLYRFLQKDWQGAENEILHAVKLNPNSAIARDIYVFYLSMQGRIEEARSHAKRSLELGPTAYTSAVVASWPFITARQFEKAIEQLKRAVELEKKYPEAHRFLGVCYEAQSNYVAAIEEWEQLDLLEGDDPAKVAASYAALRQAYNSQGQEGYLRKNIELIRENETLPEAEQIFSVLDVAGYYARLGEKEKALDELEKHFDHRLKFDPMYDTLHDEPRFKALLKRAGLEK